MNGPMKISEIRDRCRIEDGHWLWAGAVSKGVPRIWAPDFTLHAGKKRTQTGRRAVWHVKTGKPIPNGWRVFGTCEEPMCISPDHADCMPVSERGAKVAEKGTLKGIVTRIVANRAAGRKRTKVTPELIQEIVSSPKIGREIALDVGVSRQVISKVRQGRMASLQAVGGLFSGLMGGRS